MWSMGLWALVAGFGLGCRSSGPAATGAAGGSGGAGGSSATGAGGSSAGGAGGSSDADAATDGNAPGPTVIETLDVTDVWSGHPVAFSLVTRGDQQLAAFYDANRQMTVAQRTLGSSTWKMVALGTMLGWDSHNYVTMAVDGDGIIHVAG